MNFLLIIFNLCLLAEAEAQCSLYEVKGRIECSPYPKCELIIYPGSFSEKKIILQHAQSFISTYDKSFVLAKVNLVNKSGSNMIGTIEGFPKRISPPPNLGSMKMMGEKKCP